MSAPVVTPQQKQIMLHARAEWLIRNKSKFPTELDAKARATMDERFVSDINRQCRMALKPSDLGRFDIRLHSQASRSSPKVFLGSLPLNMQTWQPKARL